MMPRRASIDSIILATRRELNLGLSELLGRDRDERIVLAKEIIVHLARELTYMSYPEIARAMARQHHSTFTTAHYRLKRMLEREQRMPEHERLITQLLERVRYQVLMHREAAA